MSCRPGCWLLALLALGADIMPSLANFVREMMDEEANKIVDDAYERTLELLREKHEAIVSVAQLLLEKETINHSDIVEIIGKRPFVGDKAYEEFVTANTAAPKADEEADEADDDMDVAGTPNLALMRSTL